MAIESEREGAGPCAGPPSLTEMAKEKRGVCCTTLGKLRLLYPLLHP